MCKLVHSGAKITPTGRNTADIRRGASEGDWERERGSASRGAVPPKADELADSLFSAARIRRILP